MYNTCTKGQVWEPLIGIDYGRLGERTMTPEAVPILAQEGEL